jgi:Flp pilus assembly protein TadG
MQMEVNVRSRISKSGQKGSSLVETVCGCIILVIVTLFLVDVAAVVVCQTQNDALAKHCARACASQPTQALAQTAMNDVTASFVSQNGNSKLCYFTSATIKAYDPAGAAVIVQTLVTCNFPVPIPFGPGYMIFTADATEPIVAVLP